MYLTFLADPVSKIIILQGWSIDRHVSHFFDSPCKKNYFYTGEKQRRHLLHLFLTHPVNQITCIQGRNRHDTYHPFFDLPCKPNNVYTGEKQTLIALVFDSPCKSNSSYTGGKQRRHLLHFFPHPVNQIMCIQGRNRHDTYHTFFTYPVNQIVLIQGGIKDDTYHIFFGSPCKPNNCYTGGKQRNPAILLNLEPKLKRQMKML